MKVLVAPRRVFGVVGALAVAITIVVLTAAPASAHAVLKTTTPTEGQTVAATPKQIDLAFSEDV